MSRQVHVRVPELSVGPPNARFKRAHERVVDIGEAELLASEVGAEILDDPPEPKAKTKAKSDK